MNKIYTIILLILVNNANSQVYSRETFGTAVTPANLATYNNYTGY